MDWLCRAIAIAMSTASHLSSCGSAPAHPPPAPTNALGGGQRRAPGADSGPWSWSWPVMVMCLSACDQAACSDGNTRARNRDAMPPLSSSRSPHARDPVARDPTESPSSRSSRSSRRSRSSRADSGDAVGPWSVPRAPQLSQGVPGRSADCSNRAMPRATAALCLMASEFTSAPCSM